MRSYYADQFVLARTRSGDYKEYADQSLRKVVVQIDIESFVSFRAVRELLSKVMSERKFIHRHMINNVRIRSRKRKLELENADIETYPKYFGSSFITTYRDTSDNYTEGKIRTSYCLIYFHNCSNVVLILNVWYRSY